MLQGRVGAQNPISKAHENTYFQSKKKKCRNKHLCAYIVMHTRKYFYKLENQKWNLQAKGIYIKTLSYTVIDSQESYCNYSYHHYLQSHLLDIGRHISPCPFKDRPLTIFSNFTQRICKKTAVENSKVLLHVHIWKGFHNVSEKASCTIMYNMISFLVCTYELKHMSYICKCMYVYDCVCRHVFM